MRHRLKIKNLIKITLALALLWILVKNSLLNFKLLLVFLNKPNALFVIAMLMVLNVLLSSWRWFRLNMLQNLPISYTDTFLATYVGLTFNNLFLGSVGGDLIRVNYLFKRMPQQKIAGTLTVLADRACGLLGVFFTLCILGLAYKNFFAHSIYLSLFLNICLWMSLLAFIAILCVLVISKFQMTDRIQSAIPSMRIVEFIKVMRIYKQFPWIIVECVILSISIQVLLAYIVTKIGQALDFNTIHFLAFTIANLITQLTSLLPVSPGGLGVGEMAFAKSITQLTGQVGAYATIYLAYRILTMIFSVPGVFIFLKMNKHPFMTQDQFPPKAAYD